MSEDKSGKDEVAVTTETGEGQTTPPQPKAAAEWSMPEPVFQQTSGYLPQGFVKQIENADGTPQNEDMLEIPAASAALPISAGQNGIEAHDEPILEVAAAPDVQPLPAAETENYSEPVSEAVPVAAAPAITAIPAASAVSIEPQPNLSEQISDNTATAKPSAPAAVKSTGLRTVLIILVLLGMVALLAAFAVFVYTYLIPESGGVNF